MFWGRHVEQEFSKAHVNTVRLRSTINKKAVIQSVTAFQP